MQTIKAKKSLGQNFLIDPEALSDIANSITLTDKHIIEVWPGYGALTEYIVASVPLSLDLVELDTDMVEILNSRFKIQNSWWKEWNGGSGVETVWAKKNSEKWWAEPEGASFSTTETFDTFTPQGGTGVYKSMEEEINIYLHHQDVLTYTPIYEEYSVIANIPYYITSPILFHFLYPALKDRKTPTLHPPQEMTIMMQKEVGEKILEWRARKPHHSYLSLAMELACDDIEIVRYVGKESFDPAPKVDSIVLRFSVKKHRDRTTEESLLALWRCAFSHPRKTLLSNLKWTHYSIEDIRKTLTELGYDERVRAEAVKMEDWGKLC